MLLIAEDKVIREHGIASITCLLSGLKVFQPNYPHFDRSLRVLKGLHGFHIYATEYWVDYILSIVTSPNALSQPDLLPSVLNDLSKNLDSLGESFNAFDDKDNSTLSESGLDLLKAHKGLYASAIAALEARSRKGFGDELEEEGMSTRLFQSFTVLKCTPRFCSRFRASERIARCSCELPSDHQIASPYPGFPWSDARGTRTLQERVWYLRIHLPFALLPSSHGWIPYERTST
jgi:hypothetical protein